MAPRNIFTLNKTCNFSGGFIKGIFYLFLFGLCASVYSQNLSEGTEASENNKNSMKNSHVILTYASVGLGGLGILGYHGEIDKPVTAGGSTFASEIGVLYSFGFLAAELNSQLSLLNHTVGVQEYEQDWHLGYISDPAALENYQGGDLARHKLQLTPQKGIFWATDIRLGFKILTKKQRLGYTFFYGGPRFYVSPSFEAVHEFQYTTQAGAVSAVETIDASTFAAGWVLGLRDLTGWPLGKWTLIHEAGLNLSQAPLSHVHVSTSLNGGQPEVKQMNTTGLNIGLQLGVGVALEPVGLGIMLTYKMDFYRTVNNKDFGFGFFLGQIQLKGVKQFEL